MFGNSCNGIHRRINSVLIPIICAMNNEWIVINVIISIEELINKWYTELRKPQIGLSYMISCIQDTMLFATEPFKHTINWDFRFHSKWNRQFLWIFGINNAHDFYSYNLILLWFSIFFSLFSLPIHIAHSWRTDWIYHVVIPIKFYNKIISCAYRNFKSQA